MTQQPAATDNRKILRNDILFTSSMLVACCIFMTSLVAMPFWEFEERQQFISANATATAYAVSTQQANAVATATARSTEQEQYEYIVHFNQNLTNWYVGEYDTKDGNVEVSIKNGVYTWKIVDAKGHIQGTDLSPTNRVIEDFDVYIDSGFVDSSGLGAVCSGLVFRRSALGWDDGAYVFSICTDSRYEVHYYHSNTWENITLNYHDAIQRTDWNRIGVGARGDRFTFTINNLVVFEMTDDRQKIGGLEIFIEVENNNSAEIWFDNFGFQIR